MLNVQHSEGLHLFILLNHHPDKDTKTFPAHEMLFYSLPNKQALPAAIPSSLAQSG